jgi:hypothetical protein
MTISQHEHDNRCCVDRIWEFEINWAADADPFGESGLKYIINKLMLSAFDFGLL